MVILLPYTSQKSHYSPNNGASDLNCCNQDSTSSLASPMTLSKLKNGNEDASCLFALLW